MSVVFKPSFYSVENYIENVRDTLDYLQSNLPRVMINLILNMDQSCKSSASVVNLKLS
jgi:hypothetical protein